MPKFADLVGAERVIPVMTTGCKIESVPEDKAISLAIQYHGLEGAQYRIGQPRWVIDEGAKNL